MRLRGFIPILVGVTLLCLLSGCAGAIFPKMQVLTWEGRNGEAVQYFKEQNWDMETVHVWYLHNLCLAQAELGQYDDFFECNEVLLRRYKERGVNDRVGIQTFYYSPLLAPVFPLNWAALAYIELGDYDTALEYANESIDRVAKVEAEGIRKHAGFPDAVPNVLKATAFRAAGIALAFKGETRKAEVYAERILAEYDHSSPTAWGGDRYDASRIYMALGKYDNVLELMEDYDPGAFFRFQNAMTGIDHTYVHFPKAYILAKAQLEAGDPEIARQTLEKVMKYEGFNQSNFYRLALDDLGKIAEMQNRPDDAITFYVKAVERIEASRSSIDTEAAKIGFVQDKQALYGRLVALLVDQGRAAEAFEYVERGKARALVDLLAERQEFAGRSMTAVKSQRVLAELAELESEYIVADETMNLEAKQGQERAIAVVRQRVAEEAPELASLVAVTTPQAKELLAPFGAGETLLEYYQHGDDLFAFVATDGTVRAKHLDGRGLAEDVQAFRDALKQARGDASLKLSQKLYDRLVRPMGDVVSKSGLVVVGHGPLHYVPFAALHDGIGYLVDKVTLRVLPSASVMSYLADRDAKAQGELLALGNPDLGDPQLDLPGAEVEVREIKAIVPEATILLRQGASEAAVKKGAQAYGMLHFASHGLFDTDDPLHSGLMLAPGDGEDGRLTAGELYGMTLSADLVTLSACETGLGKTAAGDDVIGLTRGFLYAGTSSLVSTLWQVADKETAFLMTTFYENLKTMPKAEALHQAQLALKERSPHPYYWAAFQLTGAAD